MKTKTIYVHDDGKEFGSEHELRAYDKTKAMADDINAFIAEFNLSKPMAGMLRKQIPAYTAWVEAQGADSDA